jgi:hypothetical protein
VGATANNAVIDDVIMDSANGLVQVKLQKQSRPFMISLPAFYPVAEGIQQASLELPRPMQSLDRGGQVKAILPGEGWEFVNREAASGAGFTSGEEIPPGEHEHTWQYDRAPAHIELTWRPYRPELEVHSVVDVNLAGPRARVQQELRIQSQSVRSTIRLQIPPAIAGVIHVIQGGKLSSQTHEVALAKSDDKTRVLILEYSFPFDAPPNGPNPFDLPFVKVTEATRSENKVRVWTEPGVFPVVDQALWEEMPLEVVPGKDELPSLVVRSGSMDHPLHLRLKELPGIRPASTIIARALIQVAVDDPGQSYRARFLLTQLHTRQLEIAFPFPVAQLSVKTRVNGHGIQCKLSQDPDHLRVDLESSVYPKPLLIELQYRVPSELLRDQRSWRMKLTPPAFADDVFVDRVRWQVSRPGGNWVTLLPGLSESWDPKWEWQGSLLAPRPAVSSGDLERWLAGAGRDLSEATAEPQEALPSELTCGRASLASLDVLYVWQPMWLMACSLTLVTTSLGLAVAARSGRWRGLLWAPMTCLVLIALAAATFWPGMVPAVIYGCEPGVVILVGLLIVQWLVHQRYRRQVVFLPGFTRLKTGSSIIRAGLSPRILEPTTVDAPAKPASENQK